MVGALLINLPQAAMLSLMESKAKTMCPVCLKKIIVLAFVN
jgi:hypothetical protein